ncbi:uracil permease [Propionigenium maris DSM 9537]|uniref:Uracil permease n=1 Tax=Propionigenium maris DSM 9537 TaxID=1123000 RepID=A0A9W6GL31_9FUSO|nr:nucleobase:cation symporter-2 family protein [Propionigenium maris]GLI57084.1 uracil permease [Propionigenium maris DSM 9537]
MTNRSPYHLDGRPPLKEAFPLGLQHILAMFVSNLAPILIVSGAIGVTDAERTMLVQCAMLMGGVCTLIQTYRIGRVGAKLPVVVGTSFAFVPVALSIGSRYGMEGVLGAALVGGIFEAFLGTFISKIKKFFPPIVTGVVVLSIGLSLLPVGIKNFAGGVGVQDFGSPSNLALGFIVLISVIFLKQFTKGITSTGAIALGTLVGVVAATLMGKMSFAPIGEAAIFTLPKPFMFGFAFHLDAILAMMLMFVVSAVETVGDMSGVALAAGQRDLRDDELTGGIIADGLGSALSTVFGNLPMTSFSQNTGIIIMTGVVSRFVVGLGGAILVAGAFIPKIGALFTAIPTSVIGGSLVMVFAMITIGGIRLITKEPLSNRNSLIVAVSLGLGFGLGSVPEALAYFPEAIQLIFGGSGIVVAGGIAIIMNVLLPAEIVETEKSVEAKLQNA